MSEQQVNELYYQSGIAQMQEEIQTLRANLAAVIKERDEGRRVIAVAYDIHCENNPMDESWARVVYRLLRAAVEGNKDAM